MDNANASVATRRVARGVDGIALVGYTIYVNLYGQLSFVEVGCSLVP